MPKKIFLKNAKVGVFLVFCFGVIFLFGSVSTLALGQKVIHSATKNPILATSVGPTPYTNFDVKGSFDFGKVITATSSPDSFAYADEFKKRYRVLGDKSVTYSFSTNDFATAKRLAIRVHTWNDKIIKDVKSRGMVGTTYNRVSFPTVTNWDDDNKAWTVKLRYWTPYNKQIIYYNLADSKNKPVIKDTEKSKKVLFPAFSDFSNATAKLESENNWGAWQILYDTSDSVANNSYVQVWENDSSIKDAAKMPDEPIGLINIPVFFAADFRSIKHLPQMYQTVIYFDYINQ